MVIFRPESDDIIWTNDRFLQLTGEREHLFDAKLSAVIPGFDTRWLMEGKNECPTEVSFGGRRFLVYGHLVRAPRAGRGLSGHHLLGGRHRAVPPCGTSSGQPPGGGGAAAGQL